MAPGGATVRHFFFNPHDMWLSLVGDHRDALHSVGLGLLINIKMFLIAEVFILVFGLALAWTRMSKSPVLLPFRILAIIYSDVFRGIPVLLVFLLIGYGFPALQFGFVSNQSLAVYGCTALILTYTAYVAEVFRAGIYSVPNGQLLAARSLGLTNATTMRRVILPQAVRTVIPPLLNDFISLQKDTALLSVLGVVEAVQAGTIYPGVQVQLEWTRGGVAPLLRHHHPPHPRHRPPHREGPRPTSGVLVSEVILELDNVVKRFGDNEVLRGISLNLHRHEVVCLIGASGSGKSTLLRCVNLLETIDGGTITLFGQSLTDVRIDPDKVRRHTGMVFQSFNLFPHLTVLENVLVGPVRALKRKRGDVQGEALQLLERIGLRDRCDEYPDRLSGGQQQRVAIVRSLAMRPALLLLDEVTSALDPSLVGEVLDLLRDLAHTGHDDVDRHARDELRARRRTKSCLPRWWRAGRTRYAGGGLLAPAARVHATLLGTSALGRFSAKFGELHHLVEQLSIAAPRQVRAHALERQPHQFVHLFVRGELADAGLHQVVGHDLRLALAVRVVRRAGEADDLAQHAGLFDDLAQRSLFEGLALVDLALGEGPVAARLAVDARDFDATTGEEAPDDAAGRTDEIDGCVFRDDQFTAQQIHVANGR